VPVHHLLRLEAADDVQGEIVNEHRTTRDRRSVGPRRLLAVVAAASLALLASVGPASGATREFRDPADAPGLDIRAVRVQYGTSLQVTARHQGDVSVGQTYRYYLDTTTARPGPDYLFVMFPNSDAASLGRIDGFEDTSPTAVRCDAWSGFADQFSARRPVVARISARCLGSPARVSVSLRFTGEDGPVDWAPGPRRRYGWVERG
jgi:hypothetical protein